MTLPALTLSVALHRLHTAEASIREVDVVYVADKVLVDPELSAGSIDDFHLAHRVRIRDRAEIERLIGAFDASKPRPTRKEMDIRYALHFIGAGGTDVGDVYVAENGDLGQIGVFAISFANTALYHTVRSAVGLKG